MTVDTGPYTFVRISHELQLWRAAKMDAHDASDRDACIDRLDYWLDQLLEIIPAQR